MEASWIASSSSSETTGVWGNRCWSLRYLLVDKAARTVPLERPARRRAVPLGVGSASDMDMAPGKLRCARTSIR